MILKERSSRKKERKSIDPQKITTRENLQEKSFIDHILGSFLLQSLDTIINIHSGVTFKVFSI
jgi:hypothetical protein